MAGNAQGADQVIVELSDPEQARALLDGGTLDTVQNLMISDLASQSASDVQADVCIITANYLARNTSLKRLSLKADSTDVPMHTALVQALKFHPSLEILSSTFSCMREVDVRVLSEISSNTSLKALHVSTIKCSDRGAVIALSEVLKTNAACKIETLDLGFPYLDFGMSDVALMALVGALASNRTVKVLKIGRGCDAERLLNTDAFAALCESLRSNDVIEELQVEWLSPDNAFTQALAQALASNHSITKLNLPFNQIGDDGCTALAEALKINTALTHVDFGVNRFGDAGAKALAEMLSFNSTLSYINLTTSSIGKEGAQALGTAWGSMAEQTLTISVNDHKYRNYLPHDWYEEYLSDVPLDGPDDDDEFDEFEFDTAAGYQSYCEKSYREKFKEKLKTLVAVMVEARDHQVEVRRRRELLLAFGMGLHDRLGGREDGVAAEQPGGGQMSCTGCTFHGLDENIFRLVGKGLAYV
jgi:hypothetical protein